MVSGCILIAAASTRSKRLVLSAMLLSVLVTIMVWVHIAMASASVWLDAKAEKYVWNDYSNFEVEYSEQEWELMQVYPDYHAYIRCHTDGYMY